MRWEDLRSQIATALDTDVASILDGTAFWDDESLKQWANDGLKDIAQRLLVFRDVRSYDAVTDQDEYELPNDMIKVYRVEYRQTSTWITPLDHFPYAEFDGVRGAIRSSGFPSSFTTWGIPGAGGTFILDRSPSEDLADGIRFYYYRLPREIVDDSDPVEIPAGWERLVRYYVEWHARRKEATDNRWRDANGLYEAGLEEMKRASSQHSDQMTFMDDAGYGRATQIFGSGNAF
jgi:hypothetical protein